MPGLQSVASAIETPARSSAAASGYGERVENSTPGSSVATVASEAAGQGGDVLVGQVRAVVDAGGAELHGELDAWPVAELVAVHAQPETCLTTRLEDDPGLLTGERVGRGGLAEHVDPAGVGCGRRQHGPGDELEVCRAVRGILARHHVRPQEGGLLGELGGDAQGADLVVDREAVPALDLDGGRALGAHLRDAAGHEGAQGVVVGRPGGSDGDPDAATVVGLPGHAGRELLAAVPGEHQVRVRVDEAGQHGPAADVDLAVSGRRLRRRTHPRDIAVLDDDRRVVLDAEPVGGAVVTGDELPDGGDDDAAHWCSRTSASALPSWAATSPSSWWPSSTTTRPATTTRSTSDLVAQ